MRSTDVARSLTPPDPYAVAWASLARRRAVMRVAIAAAVAAFALSFLQVAALGMWPEYAIGPLAILALVTLFGPVYFRCPRCTERFGKRSGPGGSDDPFTRFCKACGLPIGTTQAEAGSFPHVPDPYLVAWRQLARRNQLRSWGTAVWAIVVGLLVWHRLDSRGFMIVFLVASLCLLPIVILQETFVCPRCQKLFFGRWVDNSHGKRCAHCGIEVGTPANGPADAPKA